MMRLSGVLLLLLSVVPSTPLHGQSRSDAERRAEAQARRDHLEAEVLRRFVERLERELHLTAEQRNVRAFIGALRSGRGSMRQTDLAAGLPDLIHQIERRWNLACDLSRPRREIAAPIWVEHELHQIIREAAANAARHGRASALHVALSDGGGDIELSITDNGIGFPSTGEDGGTTASPWTVHERVKGLGGTLSLFSGGEGSRLQIRVPIGSNP